MTPKENTAAYLKGWADCEDAMKANRSRVMEWLNSNPRKPAVQAFSEGPERQAAYWCEIAEERIKLMRKAVV